MGMRQQIGEFFTGWAGGSREIVSEIIGRVSYVARGARSRWMRSDDHTQTDYEFWDKLRRGKLTTYVLGALFAKPIVGHLTAWILGDSFKAMTDSESTNEALSDFVDEHLHTIITFVGEAMSLGDAYLVVNMDGTLSAVPANQVEKITDPLDYRRTEAYIITTQLETATITDEYRLDRRTVTVKQANAPTEVTEFPNVIGRLPVIHLPYMASTNEVYGHPVYEALLPLFAEYDDTLKNSLEGVKTMSNPIPALEGVADPAAELEALATREETYTDSAGNTRTEKVIDMDALQVIATSGSFNLKAPSPFTADSWQMLKALFLLMLQHTNIPEWVWGGAIASSKASVDAQMPAFSKFIGLQRMMLEGVIRELLTAYLAVISLYTGGIDLAAKIRVEWPEVAPEDAEMHLKYVQHAGNRGLVTGERELELLNLVKDAAAEYQAAQAAAAAELAERDRYGAAWEQSFTDEEDDPQAA